MFLKPFASLVFAVLSFASTTSIAGIISSTSLYTPNAAGAWSYYESSPGQPPGGSINYFPTTIAELAPAQFQGFVIADPVLSAITGGDTWLGDGFETYQVFRTFVRSSISQTIGITVGGDDGHSLFVDGIFRSGAGFGGAASFDVTFQAGQVREVLIGGYNGPGNWAFVIGTPLSLPLPFTNPQFTTPLSQTAGIELSADGSFAAVPEPASISIFACMLGVILCIKSTRRVPTPSLLRYK